MEGWRLNFQQETQRTRKTGMGFDKRGGERHVRWGRKTGEGGPKGRALEGMEVWKGQGKVANEREERSNEGLGSGKRGEDDPKRRNVKEVGESSKEEGSRQKEEEG